MILTPSQLAAYATIWDFRTQIVKAVRQILDAGGITATGPGEGTKKIPRYNTSVDYQRGAATGTRGQLAQDLGSGAYRTTMYSQFDGILSIQNVVPFETDERTSTQYLTEDHVRELDRLTSIEDTLLMEPLQPFTSALLPNLDVLSIFPLEPDERPEAEREVNVAFRRWRIRHNIRPGALVIAAGA